MMRPLLCLPILLLATSCIATVDRAALRTSLQEDSWVLSDATVEELRSLEPTAEGPLRVGIAPILVHPASCWTARRNTAWTRAERECLHRLGEELTEYGILEELVVLPQILVDPRRPRRSESHLVGLRRAAARHRLDAVFVTQAVSDLDQASNALSILNLTIVGAWIVPSQETAAACVMEGALFDVRNEYLYATATGEAEELKTTTLIAADASAALERVRLAALEDLAREMTAGVLGPAK